jgi:hypothetical protein
MAFNDTRIYLRDCDVNIHAKTEHEIIEILYRHLKASNEALLYIQAVVNKSFVHQSCGAKTITDFNDNILYPLSQLFDNIS